MTAADRHKFLPLALRVVGPIFIFGIYPLSVLWPLAEVAVPRELIAAILARIGRLRVAPSPG